MNLKVYHYEKCGTCKKARAFLDRHGIAHTLVPIREKPPTKTELKRMLAQVGDSRKLFNTSGGDYRALGLSDKLPQLDDGQRIELLAGNGNLIKRPFVLGDGIALIGFNEAQWRDALL